MGPKNVPATCARDLTWIDRMYMKLENMCVEVDKNPSILLQETSKYVESQMNVVGANVKKLCTELIQDLISPPILSSEGVEKNPECAVHCKCNCMDSEKPGRTSADMIIKGSNTKAGTGVIPAKGFEEGEEGFSIIISQRENILKEGDTKAETKKIEIATQQQKFNVEGCPRKSEGSGEELNNIPGQDGTDYEEELNTDVPEEMEALVQANEEQNYMEYEEQLSLSKGSGKCSGPNKEEQGDSFGQFEAYDKNTEGEENEMMVEEKSLKAAMCRGEADLSEQASRPKEHAFEQLGTVDGQSATHINNVAETSVIVSELRSQEVKLQQKAVDFSHKTHARRLKGVSKICMEWHASVSNTRSLLDIEIASHVKMDANDAKFMYGSVFSAKDMEAEVVKNANEVGGDLKSMYSYVFSELSRTNEEEDPMIMSDFVIEEGHEDEEQSAHWFAGEDLRKALHRENFSAIESAHWFAGENFSAIDKPQQTKCSVKEFDSDWELL